MLSNSTNKEIDSLVKRVAKKSGYAGKEIAFDEYWRKEKEKYQSKLIKKGILKENNDFEEEIKTYLADSIIDKMSDGMSEEEALKITIEQFDEAELMPDMESFMEEFDDFGIKEKTNWYAKNGDEIGLYFATYVLLCTPIGAIIGYFLFRSFLSALGFSVIGFSIGCGLGMLHMARMVANKK